MEQRKLGFSQRHPFLFGLILVILAVALFSGAMAFFSSDGPLFNSTRLGQVNLVGPIVDSTDVVDWIRTLRDDETVKGVLLRVNSPGGGIAPSQEIYAAIKDLAAKKPVVASFASVAASGGYYSACPATKIVANPGSITASIGVVAEFVTLEDAMSKLGIKPEVLTTGRFKAAGTPLRELTPAQRAQILSVMNNMHEQFVNDVAKARGMKVEDIAKIADGRAVSGMQAKQLGLVDRLGGRMVAIDLLKEMCSIKGRVPLLEGPVKEQTLIQEILGINLSLDSLTLSQPIRFFYK